MFVRAPTRDGVRARTSRLLLSVRLTRRLREGTGLLSRRGYQSWWWGQLARVKHRRRRGLKVRGTRKSVGDAAHVERGTEGGERGRRWNFRAACRRSLAVGARPRYWEDCRVVGCANVRHVFLLLRSIQRALSLSPYFFHSRATTREPDHIRGVIGAWKGESHEGCSREGCLCLRKKRTRWSVVRRIIAGQLKSAYWAHQ